MFVQPLLRWKSNKYYIFWVCVCSLRYPTCKSHAPYRIVICGLSGCTTIFPTLSHKRQDFQEKVAEHKMCVVIFCTMFVWDISHSKKELGEISIIYVSPHVNYLFYLSDFNESVIFSTVFVNILKCQISWKSVQWEPRCSTRTDGQTWRRQ